MIKIFNADEKVFSSNGNVVIKPIKCIEYKKKSLNGWYIECEIPIKYKDYIEKDKLCVVKTKSKLNPQAFRIGDKIKKTKTKISFTANHVMFDAERYFLLDVRPTDLSGIGALNYINSRTDRTSPFSISSNVSHIDTAYFIRKNLLEAWTVIEERWNGVFDADNFTIRFLNSIGNDNGETVIYGKNMEEMKIFEDWSNVCTKICPVGYDELLLPEKYIESDIQYNQPYTRTITFQTDLDEKDRTEEKMIQELRLKATEYLEKNKYPQVSYEVSSNINQTMEIGDIICVKHPLADIQTEVLEYANDIILNKIFSLTFGNYSRDVKKKFESISSSIQQVIQNVSKQEQDIHHQTNLINSLNKNGHVYIDDNEILILDAILREKAKNVWRIGLGGFGFSSNGYKGPFGIAITMDGQINADFITTGILRSMRIENGDNFIVDASGNMVVKNGDFSGKVTATSGSIAGWNISSEKLSKTITQNLTYTNADVDNALAYLKEGTVFSLDSYNYLKYDANLDGFLDIFDCVKMINIRNGSDNQTIIGTVSINANDILDTILIESQQLGTKTSIGARGVSGNTIAGNKIIANQLQLNGNMRMQIETNGGYSKDITGYPMIGENLNNAYSISWNGTDLNFFVDGTNVAQVKGPTIQTYKDSKQKIDAMWFVSPNRLYFNVPGLGWQYYIIVDGGDNTGLDGR